MELTPYVNPRFSARLEQNTLFLEYQYDDIKVIYLPMWSFMRQFDTFRGQGIVKESNGRGMSWRDGVVHIRVE